MVLDNNATVADRFAAEDLAGRLRSDRGIGARVAAGASGPVIRLTRETAPKAGGEQGYELEAGPRGITVRANQFGGSVGTEPNVYWQLTRLVSS